MNLRPFLFVSTFALSLGASTQARAQSQAEKSPGVVGDFSAAVAEGETDEAEASPGDPPADEGAAQPFDPEPHRAEAMNRYELGESDLALAKLRKAVLECGSPPEEGCPKPQVARLFLALGVVLAGGERQHDAAVQAFHRALLLDPDLEVAPTHEIPRVKAAFEEAKTGKAVDEPPPPVAAPAPSPVPSGEESDVSPSDESTTGRDRLFLLASGVLKFGAWQTNDSTPEVAAQVGGTGTLVTLPGKSSGFAVGGRVRSGSYGTEFESFPFAGASAVIGSVVGPRRGNRFAYFLGGVGADFLMSEVEGAASAQFQGGVSLGGFLLGGGFDYTFNGNQAFGVGGIEIGYGGGFMSTGY